MVVDERGTPMRPERYGDLFQVHARAAGLPRIRLHDLRHIAASLLKSRGVPMLTAASLLGHDPMIFAKVYGGQRTRRPTSSLRVRALVIAKRCEQTAIVMPRGTSIREGIWWPGAGSNRRPSDFQSDARTN